MTMELVRIDRLTFMDLIHPLRNLANQTDSSFGPLLLLAPLPPVTLNFNQLYADLGSAVRRIGIYRGKIAPAETDDFLHEVFERVWLKREAFRGDSTVQKWIIGIAYNVARNKAKLFKPRTVPDLDCDALPAQTRLSPEERAMQGEAEAQLALALARVTPYEQRLFITQIAADFSVSEVARMCGIEQDKASRDLPATRIKVAKILAQLQRENGWRKR
jgi:RNA polymerase sigma factor (sigma-70 family)